MVHQIFARSLVLANIINDQIFFGDSGDFLGRAGQTDQPRMESGHILFQHGGCVAPGIDRYENRLDFVAQGGILFFGLLQSEHDIGQIDRTHVRAIAVAKIHDAIFALELCVRGFASILVGQGERATDLCPRKRRFSIGGNAAVRCRIAGSHQRQQPGDQDHFYFVGDIVHYAARHGLLVDQFQQIIDKRRRQQISGKTRRLMKWG